MSVFACLSDSRTAYAIKLNALKEGPHEKLRWFEG